MGLSRKQKMMLVVLFAGAFITMLNQTLITPALPSVMEDMAVDQATVQWLTTGFTLVNAIMIPVTAYLQDRFSTRRLFLISMALFAIGSAMCATGVSFGILLGGRLIQAAGAGILMPMTMTVLMVTFPVEKRGAAMGLFGLVIAFAPAVGPTIAGIVIDQADWHIMFLVVAALSVSIIVASMICMEARPPITNGGTQLDPLSLVLSTMGFACLLYGFSVFGTSSNLWVSVVTVVVGAVGVTWFYKRQQHLEHPMLRVDVLKNRRFLVGTIIGMLVQASILVSGILMPIYVQSLMGYPALVSGLVLMPGAIIMGIMNPVAGKLFDKHGPRKLGIIGMVLLAITTFGFGLLTLTSSIVYITILYAVRMFAMALVNMPITTWGMNALPNSVMNHGTAVNNTLRQVAGSLGTAIIISVSTITQSLTTPMFGASEGTMLGINMAFFACTLLVLVGTALTIAMVKSKPGEEAAEDEGGRHKTLLQSIMKTDIYSLREDDTVRDAMELFITKHISAAPIVNAEGEAVGFISDGDILKRLSRQTGTVMDPIVLIANSVHDETGYGERLDQLMSKTVREVGVGRSIGVSIHADIAEVCRVLAQNHLKKVPVMEDGHIVGIINRSDITQYSMREYLAGHPEDAVYCDEGAGDDGAPECSVEEEPARA